VPCANIFSSSMCPARIYSPVACALCEYILQWHVPCANIFSNSMCLVRIYSPMACALRECKASDLILDPHGHVTPYNRLAVEKPQSWKLTKSLDSFGASGPLLAPGTRKECSTFHNERPIADKLNLQFERESKGYAHNSSVREGSKFASQITQLWGIPEVPSPQPFGSSCQVYLLIRSDILT
jgi:hypothetical protein